MRTSARIVAPSTHWKRVSLRGRRCLIMLSSIPGRLSSAVLLAADLAARRASARLFAIVNVQGFRPLEIGLILSKIAQVSAKFTVQHSEHVRMFQTCRCSDAPP